MQKVKRNIKQLIEYFSRLWNNAEFQFEKLEIYSSLVRESVDLGINPQYVLHEIERRCHRQRKS